MMRFRVSVSLLTLAVALSGCGKVSRSFGAQGTGNSGDGNGGTSSNGGGGGSTLSLGSGGNGSLTVGGGALADANGGDGQPGSCDDAANIHSYVGCDFWPTIVANPVWQEFDPAVVIANGSMSDAHITVDGPNAFHQTATVTAGGLQTVLLKWVMPLKGPEFSITNTSGGRLTASSRMKGGAYHMTSDVPVTAWQFNPVEYQKPASACTRITGGQSGCLSASVDCSLLLPTTAMTGNYRIFAYASKNEGMDWGSVPGGAAITATADNTTVTVQFNPKCGVEIYPTTDLGTCVAPGNGYDANGNADPSSNVAAQNPGDVVMYQMNKGDVIELVGAWAADPQTKNADISGSVINANQPVQVVSFNAIAQLPDYSVANADHMEETVLPAEVLGNEYIVVPPTTPNGNTVGHVVRIYGNVDNTHLTYPEGAPPGAPTTINAGDVAQIPPLPTGQPAPECITVSGNCMTNMPFVVEGDQPFAVASYMVGGTLQMPGTDAENSQGDPSMTMEVTPQQFRKQYTFLAPADFLENYADVLVPTGATVTLDGKQVTDTPVAIGNSGWGYLQEKLDNTTGGAHNISTDNAQGLGLQVAGFGYATSYYYPGGLNLIHIAAPPIIVVAK
jgi:hypothetical protein